MAFSYDPSQLASNQVYQVRAELQDTNPNDQQLQDEEIAYTLTTERNMWAAAARCAEMIGRRLLRKADVRLGRSMQVLYTRAAKQWFDMAKCLRAKAMGTVVPYAGGVYASDKQIIAGDTNLVAPAFTRTMMENPWTGGYSNDSLSDATQGETVDNQVI